MSRPGRDVSARTVVASFPVAIVLAAAAASAQAPQPARPRPAQAPSKGRTVKVQPTQAQAPAPLRRRSVVHHYPYPYPEYYYSDARAGFRNPGGQGRYAEYYPPGNHFQLDDPGERDPVRVASFDRGGGPNWDEQRAAQALGVQRYNSIQDHIDNYARFGFGWGVGGFGGFL
jgi:hypothetical protein